MTERLIDGRAGVLACDILDADCGIAASQSEKDEVMSQLNIAVIPMTSQRPVSLVGWGGGLLIGALLWASLIFWIA